MTERQNMKCYLQSLTAAATVLFRSTSHRQTNSWIQLIAGPFRLGTACVVGLSCLGLASCCLPRIFPQTAPSVKREFSQDFTAHGYLSRIVLKDSSETGHPNAAPLLSRSRAVQLLESKLPAGIRILYVEPSS